MPFDIGFIEICVLLIVALIVLGPDKLPVAARALSRFFNVFNRTVGSFKREVDRELQMDELKRQMQEQQKRMAEVAGNVNRFDLNKQVGSHLSPQDDIKPDNAASHPQQN